MELKEDGCSISNNSCGNRFNSTLIHEDAVHDIKTDICSISINLHSIGLAISRVAATYSTQRNTFIMLFSGKHRISLDLSINLILKDARVW